MIPVLKDVISFHFIPTYSSINYHRAQNMPLTFFFKAGKNESLIWVLVYTFSYKNLCELKNLSHSIALTSSQSKFKIK